MWASSQPRENEQCLLRGAQNGLSQWNVPSSQAKGNFNFFFKPWWELVGKAHWEERKRPVGFEVGPCRGAGCTAEGYCYLCYFPLEIVTSPVGLHVGSLPQMHVRC